MSSFLSYGDRGRRQRSPSGAAGARNGRWPPSEYDAGSMTVDSPARTCPRCDASVAQDAKFCANCGHALGDLSTDDATTHARLTSAAPAPLITKMRAARLTGERKPVTA